MHHTAHAHIINLQLLFITEHLFIKYVYHTYTWRTELVHKNSTGNLPNLYRIEAGRHSYVKQAITQKSN